MANSLYQAILDKIRRVNVVRAQSLPRAIAGIKAQPPKVSAINPLPTKGNVILPFAPGRIYRTIYTNYKRDPRPLVFIFSSDAFYTHAINIHYLGLLQTQFMRFILDLRASNRPLTGFIMYEFLKRRYPAIIKIGYRKYFTKFLRGKLVSDGVSNVPLPNKDMFITESFVIQLNRLIRPNVINKRRLTQKESELLKRELDESQNLADVKMISRSKR